MLKGRIDGREDSLGDGVRIKDVAKIAGVAVGTVSRVLNNHATVTESIRRKVESAILATGYELDLTAQTMRGQRSRRSEEHTSKLQSPDHLVCRLLLEKKKNNIQ